MPFRLLKVGSILVPLLLIALISAFASKREHDRARERAFQNAELVSQYMQRVLDVQASLLDRVEDITTDLGPQPDVQALHKRLVEIELKLEYTLTIGVALPDGRLISSGPRVPAVPDVKDRDYFKYLEQDGRSSLVDRLVLQPSGRDSLVFASRMKGEGFRGIAISTTPVAAIRGFLSRIRTGERSAASIIRSDGKLLIRHEQISSAVHLPTDAPVLTAIAEGGGMYEATAVTDNVARLYATVRVGDSNLFANYGVDKSAITTAWLAAMAPASLLLILSGLLGFAMAHQVEQRVLADQARREAEFDRRLLHEAERRATLQTTLLQEMHHRIKNNLQIVSSLVALHTRDNPGARDVVARIQAVASIHDMLYQTGSGNELDLSALLGQLLNNPSLVPPERGINTSLQAEPIVVGADIAVPIALVVSELVVNAIKHAFPDGGGSIGIILSRAQSHALLTVHDDGVGMHPSRADRRSGLRLVDILVRQIAGSIEVSSIEGTRATIRFPLNMDHAASA